MLLETLIFVSKRLQPACAALICLAIVQLVLAAASPAPVPPGAVRVAIAH